MKIGKRINNFIKHNIPRDVNSSSSNIKTLETLVHVAITKERTLLRSVLEFLVIVGAHVGPTSTIKRTKSRIIRLLVKQSLKGSLIFYYFARHMINEKCSSEKRLIPELKRHGCLC